MMGFEEYCKKNQYSLNQTRSQAFTLGAASRQAEVEALSALGEMSEQKIDDLVERNVELQKRIDEALDLLHASSEHRTQVPVSRLFWILKGK